MQKDKSTKWLYIIGLFFVVACNKNSTELPPIITTPKTFTACGKLNDEALVDINISQWRLSAHDSLALTIKNRTSDALSDVRVVVEWCSAGAQTYTSCKKIWDTTIAKLGAGSITPAHGAFIDKNTTLSANNVNVYMISCTRAGLPVNPLHGVYVDSLVTLKKSMPGVRNNSGYTYADAPNTTERTTGTQYLYCHAYVQQDGRATIRLKATDSIYYNVEEGRFYDTLAFGGKLVSKGALLTPVTLEKLVHYSADNIIVNLALTSKITTDSSSNIYLNLKRN